MRKHLIGLCAAAFIALAAGCGSDEPATPTDRGESATSTSASTGQAEHNDQDIAFATAMIPHHRQAVDMARMAVQRATDAKVKDLASRIEGAQEPEIEQLTGMLARWGAPAPSTGSEMPGMDHGDESHGQGMMTDEQMGQLEQATGADFDRMWVEMMIEHHQGAVDMANTELSQGSDAEAKELAQNIIDTQEAEITEMRQL